MLKVITRLIIAVYFLLNGFFHQGSESGEQGAASCHKVTKLNFVICKPENKKIVYHILINMSTSRSMSTTSIMIYMYRSQGFPNIVGLQKWPAGSYENLASPPLQWSLGERQVCSSEKFHPKGQTNLDVGQAISTSRDHLACLISRELATQQHIVFYYCILCHLKQDLDG